VRPAAAQDPAQNAPDPNSGSLTVTSSIDLTNVYMFRGIRQDDTKLIVWPAADLGLQVAIGEELALGSRASETEVRSRGESWRPWRSVAACLFWQSYLHARGRAAPQLPSELYA